MEINFNISIRKEKLGDVQGIEDVTVAAFLEAPHTDHTEQLIVSALRESGALAISLVAIENESIVGHVALSPVVISDGSSDWFGLGPLSVSPAYQRRGIGSKLMKKAIQELKNINANGCVLLGDPQFYQRFGFRPESSLKLLGVPPEFFQALLLRGELPQGNVTYHKAFSVNEA